ncbi:MAG: hypothetical protein ABI723_00785 [Bacteroidia bacterium]
MKKIFIVACTLLMGFSLNTFGQKKKVAVVTFYGDKYISFSELDGTAALAGNIATLAKDTNFNIKPIVTKFHDTFFNELAAELPFELYPEEKVIKNPQYISYKSVAGETEDDSAALLLQHYVVADGYKPLLEFANKKARNELKMLEIFGPEVDGVMFVYIDFAFVKKIAIGGTGSAGMRAYVRMKLWNKAGDKVFTVNESANSGKTIGIVAGVPVLKVEKILPLCQDAANEIIGDLKKRIPKMASKVDKKL